MSNIIRLLSLAFLCMALWLSEILIHGWIGLEWLNYVHWSLLIILALILSCVIKVNGKFEYRKHLLYYPLMGVVYMAYLLILISGYPNDFYYNSMARGAASSAVSHYIPLFLFPIATLLWNLMIARIERRKLTHANKFTLIIGSFSLPVISIVMTMLIFTQSYLFPPTSPRPIPNGLEPIHWIKSGSLIFAIIIYEGFYYLWLKSKISFNLISTNLP